MQCIAFIFSFPPFIIIAINDDHDQEDNDDGAMMRKMIVWVVMIKMTMMVLMGKIIEKTSVFPSVAASHPAVIVFVLSRATTAILKIR